MTVTILRVRMKVFNNFMAFSFIYKLAVGLNIPTTIKTDAESNDEDSIKLLLWLDCKILQCTLSSLKRDERIQQSSAHLYVGQMVLY